MTELIRIDPTARLDALRSQVAQFRRTHIVVELPDGWEGLANAARMRLLQRQVQVQRCHMAVVTRDAATVRAAHAVGVPVFGEVETAFAREWRMDPTLPLVDLRNPALGLPEPPRYRREKVLTQTALPQQYQARQRRIATEERARRRSIPSWLVWVGYGGMAGLIVLLLALFGLFVLPAATITVTPGTAPLSVTTRLVADPDIEESNLAARKIKGRLVETIIEEQAVSNTSGSLQKPTINATGEVVFSNLGTEEVRVPLGTTVSTGTGTPVSFRTLNEGVIPGGVGQRVAVAVEALEPGISGNVRANTITNIDGPLRFRARVSNPNGTGGGGSELVRAVTQADKDKLLEETQARAEGRAVAALQEKLNPGEWLPPESVQTFVVAQAFDQYNDDAADQVNLTLRLLVQGVAVDEAEAREVLQAAAESEMPAQAKLVANSLVGQRVPGAAPVGRGVEFTMTVNADYVIPVDPAEVRSAVAGQTEEEAARTLNERWLLAAPPNFYRDPQWLATLPALPSRIQVRVNYGDTAAAGPAAAVPATP
jgi:hypothetical protein